MSDELIKEFSGRMCRARPLAHCASFRADAELVNVPRPGMTMGTEGGSKLTPLITSSPRRYGIKTKGRSQSLAPASLQVTPSHLMFSEVQAEGNLFQARTGPAKKKHSTAAPCTVLLLQRLLAA